MSKLFKYVTLTTDTCEQLIDAMGISTAREQLTGCLVHLFIGDKSGNVNFLLWKHYKTFIYGQILTKIVDL